MQFGRYELGERIARGGMAEVFAARHFGAEGFVKSVAIKRILPHYCEDPEFVRLFINEATLAAELRHANIVQIHDFDHVEGSYYIAMELVAGQDLRRVLRAAQGAGRRLPVDLGVHVVAECLKGLVAAHELCDEAGVGLSIVHRDLSPHNMLLSYAGEVKVTDFGIAKAATRGQSTGSDVIRGKLPYMSPEQVQGQELDQRSDLFSLGITLWELVTGDRLYGHTASDGLLLEVAEARVPDPTERNAGVSPGLREVILRLLEREPQGRYATAREALAALRQRGGAADRSLELASFMEELFPEEAAAARRSRTTLTEEVGDLAPLWEKRLRSEATPPPDAAAGGLGPRRWLTAALVLAVILAAAGVVYLAMGGLSGTGASAGEGSGGQPAVAGGTSGGDAGARPRARVRAALNPASPAGASLVVLSTPPGAVILVDGVPTGRRTPARFGVRAGLHRVRVRWDAGSESEQRGELIAGRTQTLRFTRPGRAPAGRRVGAHGGPPAPRQRASAEPRPAAPGTRPRPAGRPSKVRFTCKPWAHVRFGGTRLGQTPRSRTLGPGSYRVTFSNPALGLTRHRTFRVPGDGRDVWVSCRF